MKNDFTEISCQNLVKRGKLKMVETFQQKWKFHKQVINTNKQLIDN